MSDCALFAVVTPGFEEVAADEIKESGFRRIEAQPGGVSFQGHPLDANLRLGIPT